MSFDQLFLTVCFCGNFHVISRRLFLATKLTCLSEKQGQDRAIGSMAEGRCWQVERLKHRLVSGLSDEDIEALGGILERDAILRLNIEALCGEAFNN